MRTPQNSCTRRLLRASAAATALLLLPLSSAPAAGEAGAATPAGAVLAANRQAMGEVPASRSLMLRYELHADGLAGTALVSEDPATGAFVEEDQAGLEHTSRGFDGRTPWQRDISGVSTPQLGGDRLPVAVSEAYRNANLWWRPDHGGAGIRYVGRESRDGRVLDHLEVTPRQGRLFDAWFDSASHLLTEIAEQQQFFKTRTSYGDYRGEQGVMVAHRRTVDFGTGPGSIKTYQLQALALEAPQPLSAYARPTDPPPGGVFAGGRHSTVVPFRFLNNHVYVEASVNGKGPYTFIIDTGGHTLISPRLAAAAGLRVEGESASSGAGEKTSTLGFAPYHEIAIGNVRLTNQTAFVTNIYDRSVEGIDVDGMLGFELFARFAVTLDYGAKTMTITDFGAFDAKQAGTPVPFVFYDHVPNVDGTIDHLPARLDIDTGSRSEVDVTSPFVSAKGLRERFPRGIDTITGWGVGGPAHSHVVRLPLLSLGPIEQKNVVAGLSDAKGGTFSDPNFEGNVGSGFLKRFAVSFDYAHQMMYLKRLATPPADAGQFDRSGLWINAAERGFVITAVAPGSPAAEAGLAAGDLITSLDGSPAVPERLADARYLLRSKPAGTSVPLSAERGTRLLKVILKLRDLI
jgi:hypothetical protein